jgi:hypothetical protein
MITHITCPHALPTLLLLLTVFPLFICEFLGDMSERSEKRLLVLRLGSAVDKRLLATANFDRVREI